MTDDFSLEDLSADEPTTSPAASAPRQKRDPAGTLSLAMLVYIAVNAIFGVLLLFPAQFYDFVGVRSSIADDLGGLRWVGAMLLSWAVAAILVLARPVGRAFFVTTGSLQLTVVAVALAYSLAIDDGLGATWFQILSALIWAAAAGVMWWARLGARKVLSGKE